MAVRRRPVPPPDPPPAPPPIVPEYVATSPLLRRHKITKRKLPSFTEAMLLLHMPELQRKFYAALYARLEAGDKDAIRVAGEIMKVLEKGGISITNQLLQQNLQAGEHAPVMGYDALARQIAEARQERAIAPPADVIDIRSEPALVHAELGE